SFVFPSSGRIYVFFFTLLVYVTFHASRKPISVVKPVLHPNCTEIAQKENKTIVPENATFCMWAPFGKTSSVITDQSLLFLSTPFQKQSPKLGSFFTAVASKWRSILERSGGCCKLQCFCLLPVSPPSVFPIFSGHVAERMDLRVFLTIGCLLSGLTTALFGLGYFCDIHHLPFYLVAQVRVASAPHSSS
ncbi:unnamed protein product, partial [Dibothriocephalus latus]